MDNEVKTLLERLNARIDKLEQYMYKALGKWEAFRIVMSLVGPILLLIGLVELIMQHGFIK